MSKTMQYFPDEDILHVLIREGDEAGSVELSPHITAELDKDGELIGIEITDATAYVRDNILESAQARLLHGKKDA
ncbi:MAG: DUF2283 domain-containing protein [Alkalispirochaeta sp.]